MMSTYYLDMMQRKQKRSTMAGPAPDLIIPSVSLVVLSWKEVAGVGQGPCPPPPLSPGQEGFRVEEEVLGPLALTR